MRDSGHYTELLDEESVIQRRISLALGRYIVKFGDAYDYPSERLFRELCKMKGMPEENWEQMLADRELSDESEDFARRT